MYLIIIIGTMIASWAVSARLKSKFKKYSKTPIGSGLSGKEIAERMLRDNGIHDVQVMSVPGQLTDHYNPGNRTVNLSPEVYAGRSAASAAVSAHECGHAIQHARSYSMLEFRSTLVPVQNVSGRILNGVFMILMFGSMILPNLIPMNLAILIIIGCYSVFTLFAFVTLPVEFDASKRALAWIKDRGVVNPEEYDMAKDALKWAAMTYVVAALGSLVQLLYWIMVYLGRSSD